MSPRLDHIDLSSSRAAAAQAQVAEVAEAANDAGVRLSDAHTASAEVSRSPRQHDRAVSAGTISPTALVVPLARCGSHTWDHTTGPTADIAGGVA
jgi:hypothetical protein